ncbi:MAG: flexitail domain-containing putative surface protein, partial [Thermomicrobiales bacterium]
MIQQQGTDVTAPSYCYLDNTVDDVNPEGAPGVKGDGLRGPFPPAPFGDVNTSHAVLTGVVNNSLDTIELAGCFEDLDGMSPLGHVYATTTVNQSTGIGTTDIWVAQTVGNCTGGTPAGGPTYEEVELWTVMQALPSANRDTDTDGCPDASELGQNEGAGGLRDPFNRWDYFNPTNDGKIRFDDIMLISEHFGQTAPGPPYEAKFDRGSLAGGNAWNIAGPDLTITIADVLRVLLQYRHDCGSGGFTKTGTPTPTGTPTATADAPSGTPSSPRSPAFSIAIDVNGDTVDDCKTNGGPTSCTITPSSAFTVKVYLNSLPYGVSSYKGFEFYVN